MNETVGGRGEVARALLETMSIPTSTSPPSSSSFTSNDNSLFAYAALFLRELAGLLVVPPGQQPHTLLVHHLCDWLLDIALCSPSTLSATSGAIIPPGLSKERLTRLKEKNDTPIKLALSSVKLQIISHLHDTWFYTPLAILVAVVASADTDAEVAKQATFKLNGMRNFMHMNFKDPEILDFLRFLLRFLSEAGVDIGGPEALALDARYFERRSGFSDDLRSDALHWVLKEMTERLDSVCDSALAFVRAVMGQTNPSARLLNQTASLLEKLSKSKRVDSISSAAPTLVEYCTVLLRRFVHVTSTANEVELSTRQALYGAIEALVSRFPLCVMESYLSLADLLFKLLDKEAEDTAPRLLGSLGSLRIAYEICDRSSDRPQERQVGPLGDVIQKARVSSEPRKRITAIQWGVTVFGLSSSRSIETIVMLLDDKNESVAGAAESKMAELYVLAEDASADPFLLSILKTFKPLSEQLLFDKQSGVVAAPIAMASVLRLVAAALTSLSRSHSSSGGFQLVGSSDFLDAGHAGITSLGAQDREALFYCMAGILSEISSYDLPSLRQSVRGGSLSSVFEEAVHVAQLCVLTGDPTTRTQGLLLQPFFTFFIGKLGAASCYRIATALSVLCLHTTDLSLSISIIRILQHKVCAFDALLLASSSSAASGPSAASAVDCLCVAQGAMVSLGAVVEMLLARKLSSPSPRHSADAAVLVAETMEFIHQTTVKYSAPGAAAEHGLDVNPLLVSCIEAMQRAFRRHAAVLFLSQPLGTTALVLRALKQALATDNEKAASFCAVSVRGVGLLAPRDSSSEAAEDAQTQQLLAKAQKTFSYQGYLDLLVSLLEPSRAALLPSSGSRASRTSGGGDGSSSTELVCRAIECFSVMCSSACLGSVRSSRMVAVLLDRRLTTTECPLVAFALAEALTRISYLDTPCPSEESQATQDARGEIVWPRSTPLQKRMEALLRRLPLEYQARRQRPPDTPQPATDHSTRFAAVLLLVYSVYRTTLLNGLEEFNDAVPWVDLSPALIPPRR